jgi:hypothetical protein
MGRRILGVPFAMFGLSIIEQFRDSAFFEDGFVRWEFFAHDVQPDVDPARAEEFELLADRILKLDVVVGAA